MYICLHVKYPLFLTYFNKTSNFLVRFFETYTDIKIYETPSRLGVRFSFSTFLQSTLAM